MNNTKTLHPASFLTIHAYGHEWDKKNEQDVINIDVSWATEPVTQLFMEGGIEIKNGVATASLGVILPLIKKTKLFGTPSTETAWILK